MRFFSVRCSLRAIFIRFLCAFLVPVFLVSLCPFRADAAGNDMNSIVRERHRVEQTLKDLRMQLGQYQTRLKSTTKNETRSLEALKNIRRQIAVYERLIAENQTLLNNLDLEIALLQKQLDENRKTYQHVSTDFQRIAVAAYKHGGDRNAELLLSSGSASEAIARSRYLGFLSRSVRSRVTDLQTSAEVMETSQAQLEESYRQKEAAMKAQQDQLRSFASKRKEKEAVLSDIKKDKQEYTAKITEVRKKQRQMQARIESLIMAQQELIRKEQEKARLDALKRQRLANEKRKAEAARQSEADKKKAALAKEQAKAGKQAPKGSETPQKEAVRPVPPSGAQREEQPVVVNTNESEIDKVSADFDTGGSLPWPVSGVVVRKFGSSHDKELNIVTISNGIDISVPAGTQVKSVSGGKVVQISYLPTFGNVVIVRHQNSYLTVYANLARVSVANGDIIRSRQLLGSAAAMPEGGAIVHFEIWKGREKQNPQKWLR